jgi:hypothetical protein
VRPVQPGPLSACASIFPESDEQLSESDAEWWQGRGGQRGRHRVAVSGLSPVVVATPRVRGGSYRGSGVIRDRAEIEEVGAAARVVAGPVAGAGMEGRRWSSLGGLREVDEGGHTFPLMCDGSCVRQTLSLISYFYPKVAVSRIIQQIEFSNIIND